MSHSCHDGDVLKERVLDELRRLEFAPVYGDLRCGRRPNRRWRRDPPPTSGFPRCPQILPSVLPLLPRRNALGARSGFFPRALRPSPFSRRVGFRDCPFGACSGFKVVAAR